MEIKKFDCTYRTGRKNGSITFEVIPDVEKPLPETLFKLYALNEFAVDALLNGYIYGSHPSQLNDYFDCHEKMLDFDMTVIKNFLINGGVNDVYDLMKRDPESAKKITRDNFREVFYKKVGIISLTEDSSNLLMWSYYTNHHGFQIEFDYNKLPFRKQGPFPINYCENIECIEVSPSLVSLGVLMQTNIKHKGWDHEKEWRILGEKQNMVSPNLSSEYNVDCEDRKFRYNSLSAIKSIQLGIRFFDKSEVNVTNSYTLKIDIKPENLLKRNLLKFLTENEIVTGIPLVPELNEIVFWFGSFQQVSEFEFVFTIYEEFNNPPIPPASASL